MELSVRERQKEHRRNKIYEAAITLFKEVGFEQTTASEIAKASGVSRGTFFNYYPYKEAVLLEYGSQVVEELRQQAAAQLAEGVPPLEVLNQTWAALAGITARERDLFLPLAHEVLNPKAERALAAYRALPLGVVIETILTPLHEAGELRDDLSLGRMSNLIADTYLLVALRWSNYVIDSSLEEELKTSLSLLLHGALRR